MTPISAHASPTSCLLLVGLILGAALSACSESSTQAPAQPLYRAEQGAIVTASDQVLYLRGVNLSGMAKGTPDHLFQIDQGVIDTLISSGLNSVRLLTFWDALMPEDPQTIDQTYLDGFVERVATLDRAGIYMVVDMHQDLWGHPFSGHGAPAWVCPAELCAGYQATSPWWANYMSPQITACFDLFWSSTDLQDDFIQAWVAVTQATCSYEHVVGYDLLNEPWPGSGLGNDQFDNEVLLPFYLKLKEGIERVCPGRLLFMEPSAAFTFGIAQPMVVPEQIKSRVVVAPHYYPSYVHEPDGPGYDGDRAALSENFLGALEAYQSNQVALWVGEYGGMTDSTNFQRYFEDLHQLLLEAFASSALWDYYLSDGGFALLDDSGELKPVYASVFLTPLPTLLPAKPDSLETDWASRTSTVRVTCARGKVFEYLFPNDGCTCSAQPDQVLQSPAPARGFVRFACLKNASVTVECGCP